MGQSIGACNHIGATLLGVTLSLHSPFLCIRHVEPRSDAAILEYWDERVA
jgi:hypothetical protein